MFKNALCDTITDDIQTGTVEQYVQITYGETTVEYTVKRELSDGGNISEVENHFQNLPYLENGQKMYDDELSVLEYVFKYNNMDYCDIDQLLWEMDVNEEYMVELEISGVYDSDYKINPEVTIKLLENSYYTEE